MNLDAEKIQLIDFSSEDDFLIDSHSDNSNLDLRLSVTCETQKELVGSLRRAKLMARPGMNDAVSFLAAKEQEIISQERENRENEFSLRRSLAWDNSFFTSPGFLELEELSLVNKGFNNSEVPLLNETQDNVRRKLCQENKASHKPGVGIVGRQRTQSSTKQNSTPPSKMMSVQDSKQPHLSTRRSVPTSREVSKSLDVQNTTDRRESVKSTRTASQTRVSTMHRKKPPLKAVRKIMEHAAADQRPGMTVSRRPDSSSVNSLSSSQSLSPIATNTSIDSSSYTSCRSDVRTADVWRSQEIEGECFLETSSLTSGDSQNNGEVSSQDSTSKGPSTYDVNTSQPFNLEGDQHKQKLHRSPIEQGSLGKGLSRQNAARRTKSPSFADFHQRSKPSSLRLPSQKIGFFDMKSGMSTSNDSSKQCPVMRARNACKSMHAKPKEFPHVSLNRKDGSTEIASGSYGQDGVKPSGKGNRRRNQQHSEKKTDVAASEEKENMIFSDDSMIELDLKKMALSPSKSAVKGSSSGQGSSSSGKRLLKAQRPMKQTILRSSGTRMLFSTKGSPLKRSAFF